VVEAKRRATDGVGRGAESIEYGRGNDAVEDKVGPGQQVHYKGAVHERDGRKKITIHVVKL